tara:strand:+ start:48 stop:2645 length:2598 start_codon:yes stop_codon:yes gene_type:complete
MPNTKVPRIATDTIVSIDNSDWNEDIALKAMARFSTPNAFRDLKKYFKAWLIEDHSDVRGLVGYNDEVFDNINKTAFAKLLTLDITSLNIDNLNTDTIAEPKSALETFDQIQFKEKSKRDIVTDSDIIQQLVSEIGELEQRKEMLVSEEDKQYIDNYIQSLESIKLKREGKVKITLQEVLDNKGQRFFTTIDINDEDMHELIGEYGFVKLLTPQEYVKEADNLIEELSETLSDKMGETINLKEYFDERQIAHHQKEEILNYLKSKLPTGGSIIEWIESDDSIYNVEEGKQSPNALGIKGFDYYKYMPDIISLTEEEAKDLKEKGIEVDELTIEVGKNFPMDRETYRKFLRIIPQDKALGIIKESLKIRAGQKLDPEIKEYYNKHLDSLNINPKVKSKGNLVQRDIKIPNTTLAFKRGIETIKFRRKKDSSMESNIDVNSEGKNTIVVGSLPFFSFNLIPEWKIGDSYTTTKNRLKKRIQVKESFTVKDKSQNKKLRKLVKNQSLKGDYVKVNKFLKMTNRVSDKSITRKLENDFKPRFEEFKEFYDEFIEMSEKEKWSQEFENEINLNEINKFGEYSSDEILNILLQMHTEGTRLDFIQEIYDDLKQIQYFFTNYTKQLKTKFKDQDKKTGVTSIDAEIDMTIDEFNELKISDDEDNLIDICIDTMATTISNELRKWVPPANSDDLENMVRDLITNMDLNIKDFEEEIQSLASNTPQFVNLRTKLEKEFKELEKTGKFTTDIDESEIQELLLEYGLYEKLSQMSEDTDVADPRNQGDMKIQFKIKFTPIGLDLNLVINYSVNETNSVTITSHSAPNTRIRDQGTTNIPVSGSKRIKSGTTIDKSRKTFYVELRQNLINLKRSVGI